MKSMPTNIMVILIMPKDEDNDDLKGLNITDIPVVERGSCL